MTEWGQWFLHHFTQNSHFKLQNHSTNHWRSDMRNKSAFKKLSQCHAVQQQKILIIPFSLLINSFSSTTPSIREPFRISPHTWTLSWGHKNSNLEIIVFNLAIFCSSFQDRVDIEEIYFAIKTYHKFHGERIPIIEKTWGQYAVHKKFFSDIAGKYFYIKDRTLT